LLCTYDRLVSAFIKPSSSCKILLELPANVIHVSLIFEGYTCVINI
jgi:hypothetical protein